MENIKAKEYFEEKKSNMRELWNLSDTQKEMMYSLMEQYAALHISDVVERSGQCNGCEESTGETRLWCCNHCGKRIEDF